VKTSRSTHRRAALKGGDGDYSEEEKLAKLPMLRRPTIAV
jgi:hypothetical protein